MNSEYSFRLEKIEAALNSLLPENPGKNWIKNVFNLSTQFYAFDEKFIHTLLQPCRDLLNRGGKRWRPLLMLLIAESLGAKDEDILPLTPLVELCHNASLIHDDIEDNSPERRGKPSVHLLYGNDTAINSGAFLYFLPLACLSSSKLPDEVKARIRVTWDEHIRRLHLGQSMDIAWHRDFRSLPSIDEYELMCRLKTGCLAGMAAEFGVYTVNPDDETLAKSFGDHCECIGIGFQILDDVKNLTTGLPGKKRGDDIVEGKKSLPVIIYLNRYPEKMNFAVNCFNAARHGGVDAAEVDLFIDELKSKGILEEAAARGNEMIKNGGDFLSEKSALLAGFTDLID